MARNPGDKNFTPREQKLKAQLSVANSKNETMKQKLKVEAIRLKDMRERLKAAKA